MRIRHIVRRSIVAAGSAVASCCAVGMSASAVASPIAGAAPAVAHLSERHATQRDARPSLEDAVYAWTVARSWLDSAELPRIQDAEAAIGLRDVHGISVIIRLGGRIVGRGTQLSGDGLALRGAMANALSEIFSAEGIVQALEVSPDELARRFTLELELAGEPVPLLGATFHDAVARIEPGIDGLAMRRGERMAMAFPGTMLAANNAARPATVFSALSTELGLGLRDLRELRRSDAVEVYRVPVRRLVQPHERAAPIEPFRNAELIFDRAVTRTATADLLAAMIARAERHQVARPRPVEQMSSGRVMPDAFRGDYRASADEARSPLALPFEQALMALALAHASAIEDVGRTVASSAWYIAERTTAAIIQHAIDTGGMGFADLEAWMEMLDARAIAATVLAMHAIKDAASAIEASPNRLAAHFERGTDAALAARLRQLVDEEGRVHVVDERGERRPAGGHDQALVAAALARIAADDASRARAAAATDAAWESVPEGLRPGLLPWIAMAEIALLDGGMARDTSPLIRLREAVHAAQVGFNDLEMAADLHGGLALVGAGITPNSQGLRPMVATAILFGDQRFTPELVRDAFWRRQAAFTRFLMQLTVLPPMDGVYRQPTRARHGVRMSMADSDQPVAAQAMAILALAETLRAWPDAE